MAERRMIAKSISISEQVAALRDDFTRLLFTWLIAHADDYGVLTGAPAKVRALVVPLLEHVTVAQVRDALCDMEQQQLIYRYKDDDGAPLIQFVTWEKHQFGLHKRTTPKHRLHDTPTYDTQENPGITEDDTVSPDVSGNFRELPGTSGSRGRARGTRHRRELELEENLNSKGNLSASDSYLKAKKGDGGGEKTQETTAETPEQTTQYRVFIRSVLRDTFHIDKPSDATINDFAACLHEFYVRSPDRTRAEAIKANEWLCDRQRNKRKTQLSAGWLHNWLTRAFTPQPPSPGMNGSHAGTEASQNGTTQRSPQEIAEAAHAETKRLREAGRAKTRLVAQLAASALPG